MDEQNEIIDLKVVEHSKRKKTRNYTTKFKWSDDLSQILLDAVEHEVIDEKNEFEFPSKATFYTQLMNRTQKLKEMNITPANCATRMVFLIKGYHDLCSEIDSTGSGSIDCVTDPEFKKKIEKFKYHQMERIFGDKKNRVVFQRNNADLDNMFQIDEVEVEYLDESMLMETATFDTLIQSDCDFESDELIQNKRQSSSIQPNASTFMSSFQPDESIQNTQMFSKLSIAQTSSVPNTPPSSMQSTLQTSSARLTTPQSTTNRRLNLTRKRNAESDLDTTPNIKKFAMTQNPERSSEGNCSCSSLEQINLLNEKRLHIEEVIANAKQEKYRMQIALIEKQLKKVERDDMFAEARMNKEFELREKEIENKKKELELKEKEQEQQYELAKMKLHLEMYKAGMNQNENEDANDEK